MRHTRALPGILILSGILSACSSSTEPKPGKPTKIVVSAGDKQSGSVGAMLTAPIAVKVTDDNGRGVPGQEVSFLVTAGRGQLQSPTGQTNDAGVAIDRWTLGTSVGAQRVTAQLIDASTGALVATAVFTATATAGPPAAVYPYSGSGQSGFPGQVLPQPLVVRVFDAYGNPVANASVAFAVTSGGGSITPATASTTADGQASATWTIGAYGQSQVVTATVGGVPPVTFAATTLRPTDGTSATLASRPFAVAVSSKNVDLVTQLDAASVTRFNGTSTTAVATIGVGGTPTDVAFNASGTRAYVANQYSDNVSIIDPTTNTALAAIAVTGNPFKLLVSPDETRLYVVTNANAVYAVDLASQSVVGQLAFTETPNGLAISSDGTKLYVGTRAGGTVVEVDTHTMTALRTWSPGGTVQEVRLSPDGSQLYTVNEEGTLFVYSLSSGSLAGTADLGSGSGAFGMAFTPDGTTLYVTLMWTGEVKVVDPATRTITRTIYVGGTPRRIAFTSDGTAVVANEAGYVTWVK